MPTCPKCGLKTKKGAKYCNKCGTPLVRLCPECGEKVKEESNFCGKCGSSLEVEEFSFLPFIIIIGVLILAMIAVGLMMLGAIPTPKELTYGPEGDALDISEYLGGADASSATPPGTGTQAVLLSTELTYEIVGCDTGFDVSHGLGEVTNVFVKVSNTGNAAASNIQLTASATDEGEAHPNKYATISSLPVGYSSTAKLTLDTTLRTYGTITVDFYESNAGSGQVSTENCAKIDENTIQGISTLIKIGALG